MHTFQDICSEIGVPLNQDETNVLTINITFLGLDIDTVNTQVKIPVNKVLELKLLTQRLSELDTLVGMLIFLAGQYQ